ncbi:unnamed protein product [Polarella glacialis]|uniref:JmjC domain-containing protein n=1 Tax=Polarella glacialis TaxID=89957 RepID=A0A813KAZ8_POLGL|nr:unnamed protein product [Polarella glacialis]
MSWSQWSLSFAAFLPSGAAAAAGAGAGAGSCGGWECERSAELDPVLRLRRGQSQFCDIPFFATSDEALLQGPELLNKAFVIRSGGKLNLPAFSMKRLRARAKDRNLVAKVGYSAEIVENGGGGTHDHPLNNFLDSMMHENRLFGGVQLERPYMFHRVEAVYSVVESEDVSIPDPLMSWNWTKDNTFQIFALGGPGSGVTWHDHRAAFETVAYGWKRWFLYPSDTVTLGGSMGEYAIDDWLRVVYPTLGADRAPLECVLGPGDLIYVPEEWRHAVMNLADTVAVSTQSLLVTEVRRNNMAMGPAQAALKGDPSQQSKLIELIEQAPLDNSDRISMAWMIAPGDPAGAEAELRAALEVDPWCLEAMNMLFRLLTEGHFTSPAPEPVLLHLLQDFKPYLFNNTRNMAANNMLAAYYKLTRSFKLEGKALRRNLELSAKKLWAGSGGPLLSEADWKQRIREAKQRFLEAKRTSSAASRATTEPQVEL